MLAAASADFFASLYSILSFSALVTIKIATGSNDYQGLIERQTFVYWKAMKPVIRNTKAKIKPP
jgi:hypothetical protein